MSSKGFTFIEMMIYTVLLSLLITGFIQYALYAHEQDIKLLNEIQEVEEK